MHNPLTKIHVPKNRWVNPSAYWETRWLVEAERAKRTMEELHDVSTSLPRIVPTMSKEQFQMIESTWNDRMDEIRERVVDTTVSYKTYDLFSKIGFVIYGLFLIVLMWIIAPMFVHGYLLVLLGFAVLMLLGFHVTFGTIALGMIADTNKRVLNLAESVDDIIYKFAQMRNKGAFEPLHEKYKGTPKYEMGWKLYNEQLKQAEGR